MRKKKAGAPSDEASWGMSVEQDENDIEPALIDAQELERRESYYRSDPRKALKVCSQSLFKYFSHSPFVGLLRPRRFARSGIRL